MTKRERAKFDKDIDELVDCFIRIIGLLHRKAEQLEITQDRRRLRLENGKSKKVKPEK